VVVVDSTWSQARQIMGHPCLQGLPRVAVADHRTAFWRRQHLGEHYLSTVEAVYYTCKEALVGEYDGRYDNLLFFFVKFRSLVRQRSGTIQCPTEAGGGVCSKLQCQYWHACSAATPTVSNEVGEDTHARASEEHAPTPEGHGSDAMRALVGAFTDAFNHEAPCELEPPPTQPAPLPTPDGRPPLGSILQLAKETGRPRKECEAALVANANDFERARTLLEVLTVRERQTPDGPQLTREAYQRALP
jgi:hypothetical protein